MEGQKSYKLWQMLVAFVLGAAIVAGGMLVASGSGATKQGALMKATSPRTATNQQKINKIKDIINNDFLSRMSQMNWNQGDIDMNLFDKYLNDMLNDFGEKSANSVGFKTTFLNKETNSVNFAQTIGYDDGTETTYIQTVYDTDLDGVPDSSDPDMDGDDKPNGEDDDTDGDGKPNSEDNDDDNDGVDDKDDKYPTDPGKSIWGGGSTNIMDPLLRNWNREGIEGIGYQADKGRIYQFQSVRVNGKIVSSKTRIY